MGQRFLVINAFLPLDVYRFLCQNAPRLVYSTRLASRHINQVGHLSKTPLNLLEIHEIGPVDPSESKQQNYEQI